MIIRTILAMSFLILALLLRTKFAFWFLPFTTRIRGKFMPACAEDPRPLCGRSTLFRTTIRGNPWNNHGIPRKKLSFPCHVPYVPLQLGPCPSWLQCGGACCGGTAQSQSTVGCLPRGPKGSENERELYNNNIHVHTDNNLHEYICIWTIERTVHKSHYPKQKYTYVSIDSYVYTYHFSGIRTKSIIKVHTRDIDLLFLFTAET